MIYEPKGRAREYAALAANLYRGCAHGCLYCYSPLATRRDRLEFHRNVTVRPDALKDLECDALEMRGSGNRILLSFTTDAYQPLEVEQGITRQAIQILHRYGLFVEILTKGGSRARRDFDLLGPGDAFATSLTLLDPAQSRQWEPEAAEPADRIETIRYAHDLGIETWASLEPVIDPAQSLELIRLTHPFIDLFKVGRLNYHPLGNRIDWNAFGHAAQELLEALGKSYYLKFDLRAAMK